MFMRGEKRERIIRVLLAEKGSLSKRELSKRADCARSWIIAFLKNLEKKNLIKGTIVNDKKKLIKYWLSIHNKPKKWKSYMIKEPLKILKNTKLSYALTTYQAENLVQKHLFPSRIDLYIEENDLEKWHTLMLKNGLYGKGNIRVITYDNSVMYKKRKINGFYIVSIPQLIIDLLSEGGVCKEAGEILLENV